MQLIYSTKKQKVSQIDSENKLSRMKTTKSNKDTIRSIALKIHTRSEIVACSTCKLQRENKCD